MWAVALYPIDEFPLAIMPSGTDDEDVISLKGFYS